VYVSAGLHSILILRRFTRITQTGRPSRKRQSSLWPGNRLIRRSRGRFSQVFLRIPPVRGNGRRSVEVCVIQHFQKNVRDHFTKDAISFGIKISGSATSET